MPEQKTYKAMQVTSPGVLELVERNAPTPAAGEVLLRVEACGVCGADAGAIEGREAKLQFPRVPGHEVVGRIVAMGPGTASIWKVGSALAWADWAATATHASNAVADNSSSARTNPSLAVRKTVAMQK